jgi:methylenetetrahydrofolate reductase (NADPH)
MIEQSMIPTSFESKLARGDFLITAEIIPHLTASASAFMERVKPLHGLVDAVNVTDAAGARPSLSSSAGAALLLREGIEPILQITCRDRNRIALVGDLLGAAAQGISNLLVLHGDDPKTGDMPEATAVYDLDSRALMSLARDMRDLGTLPSGREIESPPHFHIGCADTPVDPPPDWRPDGLKKKAAAGAQFVQTQFCFDSAVAHRYFSRLAAHGMMQSLRFIVGIGPLLSAKQARFMNEKFFGVSIPAPVINRLDGAADQREEGRRICIELMHALRDIPGIAGFHLMAPLQSPDTIAEIILASGLRQ